MKSPIRLSLLNTTTPLLVLLLFYVSSSPICTTTNAFSVSSLSLSSQPVSSMLVVVVPHRTISTIQTINNNHNNKIHHSQNCQTKKGCSSSTALSLLPKATTTTTISKNHARIWNEKSLFRSTNIIKTATTTIITTSPRCSTSNSLRLNLFPFTSLASAATSTITSNLFVRVMMACLIPTLLGFYRSEYGVSYAYGLATSMSAALIIRSMITITTTSTTSMLPLLFMLHGSAIMFYGVRLCLFLLYRECFVPKFRKFVEKIETRANERTKSNRLARTPFIVSCAFLYVGLVAPLLLFRQYMDVTTTGTIAAGSVVVMTQIQKWILSLLIGTTWFGFLLGAMGDIQKSYSKAKYGETKMVTNGLYRYVRHPNYTGEMIAWTSNTILGCITGILTLLLAKGTTIPSSTTYLFLLLSIIGNIGINFVLLQATRTLEKRQLETYGERLEYQKWIQSSWSGFK